ncbi:hypothetical protein ACFFX0_07535 [Citricoccus parietis]|uniref:Uncharacterized protein n=1 Tax=Citricoccus parietis TaxID=592307 RepID=A0ABV5FWP7_9MICC
MADRARRWFPAGVVVRAGGAALRRGAHTAEGAGCRSSRRRPARARGPRPGTLVTGRGREGGARGAEGPAGLISGGLGSRAGLTSVVR